MGSYILIICKQRNSVVTGAAMADGGSADRQK